MTREGEIQAALVDVLALFLGRGVRVLKIDNEAAVPPGIRNRHAWHGSRVKQGLVVGAADLLVTWPGPGSRRDLAWIEVKNLCCKQTAKQRDFQADREALGEPYYLYDTAEPADVLEWLRGLGCPV